MPVTEHIQVGASIIDAAAVLGEPSQSPVPGPQLNTDGITAFIVTRIVPILLAVLGVYFISRAGKGEISRMLTSTSIVIIGLVFIAGAAALVIFGRALVGLVLPTPQQ
jgi:hypothetical protein